MSNAGRPHAIRVMVASENPSNIPALPPVLSDLQGPTGVSARRAKRDRQTRNLWLPLNERSVLQQQFCKRALTFPTSNVQGHPEPMCQARDKLLVGVGVLSSKGVIEMRRLHP